jgi:hypothetical protein
VLRPARHVYPLAVIGIFLKLVLEAAASLRCGATTCRVLSERMGFDDRTPCANTGRGWMLRIGLYALCCPLEAADDWIWLMDHTLQLGPYKCLVIVGIRRSVWEQDRRPLQHEDMTLLNLTPMAPATGEAVAAQLQATVTRTGVPQAILSDGGTELKRAMEIFQATHRETRHVLDLKHKQALLLKHRLAADSDWNEFVSAANRMRLGVTQTELAFLNPPALKIKARYMNLDRLVHWARRALSYLDHPTAPPGVTVDRQRIREKLNWLRAYRGRLREWSEWLKLIRTTETHVHKSGLHRRLPHDLRHQLEPLVRTCSGRRLLHEIIEFVNTQTAQLHGHERMLGSTEVLESIIGKYKRLQSSHSAGGMTALLLSIGAFVGNLSARFIQQGLETIRTADVHHWCNENLNLTVQSQRRLAFTPQQN